MSGIKTMVPIPSTAELDAAELGRDLFQTTLVLGDDQIAKLEAIAGKRSKSNRKFARATRRVIDLGLAAMQSNAQATPQM